MSMVILTAARGFNSYWRSALNTQKVRGMPVASAVNRFLAAYPMRVVVSSAELFNSGVPFFNYIPSSRLRGNATDIVTVADMRLPNMIVAVLTLMQNGKLNLLRRCGAMPIVGSWRNGRINAGVQPQCRARGVGMRERQHIKQRPHGVSVNATSKRNKGMR